VGNSALPALLLQELLGEVAAVKVAGLDVGG
jgi:hypothetical protein